MARDPAVLGADGFRGGWVAARVSAGRVQWQLARTAVELLELGADVGAACVDAPIGLPESEPRACDREARGLLGPRRSSVFPAPVRAVLAARDYAEACVLSRAASGRAVSKQTWFITDKIRDLDQALQGRPDAVVECHPELSFLRLHGGSLPAKRTAEGAALRRAALAGWVDVDLAMERLPSGPRPDDALDALACAWSAARVASGRAERLPAGDLVRDELGRPMRIVF